MYLYTHDLVLQISGKANSETDLESSMSVHATSIIMNQKPGKSCSIVMNLNFIKLQGQKLTGVVAGAPKPVDPRGLSNRFWPPTLSGSVKKNPHSCIFTAIQDKWTTKNSKICLLTILRQGVRRLSHLEILKHFLDVLLFFFPQRIQVHKGISVHLRGFFDRSCTWWDQWRGAGALLSS